MNLTLGNQQTYCLGVKWTLYLTMLGARAKPSTAEHTEAHEETVQSRPELDGLQWGKSGLEMDEERKKQVKHLRKK